MFTKSIRWRMQLWLAFLLVCILSGFGITAYQLHRTNQLRLIDDELDRRVLSEEAWSRRPSAARRAGRFSGTDGKPPLRP